MALKKYNSSIKNWNDFEKYFAKSVDFNNLIIQDISFIDKDINWNELLVNNTTFLGCSISREDIGLLLEKGAHIYPKLKNKPYKLFRNKLYTWQELMKIDENGLSIDENIYMHFSSNKYTMEVNEALAQRIHDHSIDEALRELIGFDENGMTQKKCIGIMGGHNMARGSEFYITTAKLAKLATEKGYYVISGGGPGIMEAANLGAYMAFKNEIELEEAIQILSEAPVYTSPNYIEKALLILEKYPEGQENLAIPTWFYGHEPSNVFASHIAKYFSNSIREDILLAISLYGVIYAPGSAGTTQEIFQKAAQNHYCTYDYYSPIVFLSKKRYVEDTSIYSLLHQLAIGQTYKDLLFLTDSAQLAVEFLEKHPPIPKE